MVKVVVSLICQVEGAVWSPRSEEGGEQYLLLDNQPRMERSQDYEQKMNFWTELFPC